MNDDVNSRTSTVHTKATLTRLESDVKPQYRDLKIILTALCTKGLTCNTKFEHVPGYY